MSVTDSKREQVLKAIEAAFVAATPTGGTIFARVLQEPFEGREKLGQNVLSVLEGTEIYTDVVTPDKRDRQLEIELACRIYVPMGTKLRAGANNALADIEETIDANEFWPDTNGDNTAYATFLQSNLIDREDTGDHNVDVSLFMTVWYRSKRSNPRA